MFKKVEEKRIMVIRNMEDVKKDSNGPSRELLKQKKYSGWD